MEIQREALVGTLEGMKIQGYNYLKKISAIDFGDHLEVFYVLYSTTSRAEEIVTVKLPLTSPRINSVISVYKAADWYEREMCEMFGIRMIGRRAPRLLLEKWNGRDAPLRKGFAWGDPNYRKVEEK